MLVTKVDKQSHFIAIKMKVQSM